VAFLTLAGGFALLLPLAARTFLKHQQQDPTPSSQ
jgi:hypothetical protein